MKRYWITGTTIALMGVLALGCSGTPKTPEAKPIEPAPQLNERMAWASHQQRPGWTVNEPDMNEGKLFFTGLSGKYATEKDGRDDAQCNATNNVVKYIGTFVQNKFQQIVTSYGLNSTIVDPTRATRDFQEQLANALATRVKAKEWYIEKWENSGMKESYYLVYLLAEVPQAAIDKAYEETVNGEIEDLKKKRDATNDAKAKAQFENAMKAFEDAKKQGFGLEEKE